MLRVKEIRERIAVIYLNIQCGLEDYKEDGDKKNLEMVKRFVDEWKNMYEFMRDYMDAPKIFKLLDGMKYAIENDDIHQLPDYSEELKEEIYQAKYNR